MRTLALVALAALSGCTTETIEVCPSCAGGSPSFDGGHFVPQPDGGFMMPFDPDAGVLSRDGGLGPSADGGPGDSGLMPVPDGGGTD